MIEGNPFVDKVLVWDEFLPFVLMRERYDMVVNLEKIDGICALTDMINAWEKVGFRFNLESGEYDTYMQSMMAKEYIRNKDYSGQRDIWQKILLSMLGFDWKEQEYSLGYQPKNDVVHDVGFNYKVGSKWPSKSLPEDKWKELETRLHSFI